MAIKYSDWVGGDDVTGDGSFSTPYKTVKKALTGLTGGDEVRDAKSAANVVLTGTLNFVLNSWTVTGTDTLFSTEILPTGGAGWWDYLQGPDGLWYSVASIESDTSLTLGNNFYEGATIAGQTVYKLSTIEVDTSTYPEIVTIDVNGTSPSSRIKISGGWDLTTQTQTGITCYRPDVANYAAGVGVGVSASKQYITIEKFIVADTEEGITTRSSSNYININYCQTIGCGIKINSNNTTLDYCIVADYTNSSHMPLDFRNRTGFVCTNSHIAGIGTGVGDDTGVTSAYGSISALLQDCIFNFSSIFLDLSSGLVIKDCYQTGGIGANSGTSGGRAKGITIDGVTGTSFIYLVGENSGGGGATLINTTITNEGGYQPYISFESFGEIYVDNVDCPALVVGSRYAQISNINTRNPSGFEWLTGGMVIGGPTQGSIVNYNANDSVEIFQITNADGSSTPIVWADYAWSKRPILNAQNYYSDTVATRTTQYYGCGTIEKNLAGGISSGACVQISPNIAAGPNIIGVPQKFNFVARSSFGKTLSFYAKSIDSFDGVLTGRVLFNGKVVGVQVVVPLTGSYVKHSFVISSGDITEDGILVLELIATGTTGSVLVDKLESV